MIYRWQQEAIFLLNSISGEGRGKKGIFRHESPRKLVGDGLHGKARSQNRATGAGNLEEGPQNESRDEWARPRTGGQPAQAGAEGHALWDSISKEQVTSDNFTTWGGDAQFPLEFREEWVTDA